MFVILPDSFKIENLRNIAVLLKKGLDYGCLVIEFLLNALIDLVCPKTTAVVFKTNHKRHQSIIE